MCHLIRCLSCATTSRATDKACSKAGFPTSMLRRQQRCRWRSCGSGRAEREKRGRGVLEYRIDWGPGYRVYFGRDGEMRVILLTGGAKKRQQCDIERAKELWADYKRRRRPPAR
jgi:putative addiction module killer protein